MESHWSVSLKTVSKTLRILYVALKKGISNSKRDLLAGKIAAFHSFVFRRQRRHRSLAVPEDYEFSCGDTPAYRFRKARRAPPPLDFGFVAEALEMCMTPARGDHAPSWEFNLDAAAAEFVNGSGRGVGRRMISDSHFVWRDGGGEDDCVDEAAEEFIMRFYRDLKKQNSNLGSCY